MPQRSKKAGGGRRGNFQNTPPRGPRRPALDPDFVPFASTSTPRIGQHGFTLQEEARNTERHQLFWDTDQKLRHSRVTFVSAGTIDPTKEELQKGELPTADEPDTEMAGLSLQDLEDGSQEPVEVDVDEDEVEEEQADPGREAHIDLTNGPSPERTFEFVVDTQGSEPVQTGLPPARLRSASPTPSDSSEEIILFRGRDKLGRGLIVEPAARKSLSRNSQPEPQARQSHSSTPANVFQDIIQVIEDDVNEQPREIQRREHTSRRPTDPFDARIRMVEDEIHKREELLQEVLHQKGSPAPENQSSAEISMAEMNFLPHAQSRSSRRSRRGKRHAATEEQEEEDALIADYIANMDEEDVNALKSFGARELGGAEDGLWQETEASSGEPSGNAKQHASRSADWNREDIVDFDDLSTSDEVRGEVKEILSKRTRPSGLQYLVVWENMTTDEARWVHDSSLSSISAWKHIQLFEAEEKLVAEFQDAGEEDKSDSEEIDDEEDDDEDEADEADLSQRKQERMSDERIARLLAKQEELGMGSAELMLFDDDEDADEEELAMPKSFTPVAFSPRRTRASVKAAKRPRGEFPSATFLADAYDGFDVMDFERPSLQKKPKGRKGKIVFDLSDSELEASMQMACENDRSKKKERKQEREELRAQGLLAKKGKPDLKQKYKEGMGIHAVKDEIKAFLMSDNTTLALPPMDKADRKIVHEFANTFNLKSKSVGSGTDRSPVLYRTSKTALRFDAQRFDNLVARLSKRFLPSMRAPGSHKWSNPTLKKGGGGFNNAAVSYRDGDIVGGSAPELGAENRGRLLLEKMGWSQGTALGALNNKGIMQPVTHVVKTTKAGLG